MHTDQPQGFPAKFASVCARCGHDIPIGTPVLWANHRRQDVVHVGCASGADE